jgi:class 3 adenylate cyclase
VAFEEARYAIDVRAILGNVQAPTLVLAVPGAGDLFRGTGDVTRERYLADRIPGATYVDLPGTDFGIDFTDPEVELEEMHRFLRSVDAEEAAFDRVLATVLFTDIVGSTDTAVELGDSAWKQLLERHHQVVRSLIGRYRAPRSTRPAMASSPPGRGVRCARSIVDAMRPLGIEVRAGLHTGEVETIDGKTGGVAVVIGARIAALARASEVLVSSTVKDLASGSGLVFEDAGEHEIKGVPDRWRLYRATGETS